MPATCCSNALLVIFSPYGYAFDPGLIPVRYAQRYLGAMPHRAGFENTIGAAAFHPVLTNQHPTNPPLFVA